MTQEMQAKYDLKASTAIGAIIDPIAKPTILQPGTGKTTVPPIAPIVAVKKFACSIGVMNDPDNVCFYLTKELCGVMQQQFGKRRRFVVVYEHPQRWTLKPSNNEGRLLDEKRYRVLCIGGETVRRLGHFSSTKGEATLQRNCVEIRLIEPVVAKPVVAKVAQPAPAAPTPVQITVPDGQNRPAAATLEAVFIETPTAPEPPVSLPEPPSSSSVPSPVDRYRAALRLIKELEDEGIYRLIRLAGDNGWRWRADIGLED